MCTCTCVCTYRYIYVHIRIDGVQTDRQTQIDRQTDGQIDKQDGQTDLRML